MTPPRYAATRPVEGADRLEVMGALTRRATHDVNNHMAAILSFAELVLEALPPEHPLRAEVEAIRHAGFRAIASTRELAQLARQMSRIGSAA